MAQQPLRFLFVAADKFPPFRPDVEVLFGREFLRRGHRIDWVMQAAKATEPAGLVEWRGCRVQVARTDEGKSRLARLRKHLLAIANELRAPWTFAGGSYDFVQVKDKFLSALVLLAVAKLKRRPFFFWLSFPYPEASLVRARAPDAKFPVFYRLRGTLFGILLYSVICRLATHVFVQSEEMKRTMAARGVPSARMTAVPMGVDLADFAGMDAREPEAGTIVYLGSLGKERHLEFLIDALARVRQSVPDVRLILVGDGEEPEDRPRLERHVREAGVADCVEFTGFMPRAEALGIVSRAAVGASPIRPTPMYDVASPTKILEYMAAGVPAVANDQPDQRDVLGASRAGICTPYDADAFAEALIGILADPVAARAMGQRGRAWVAEHRSYSILADRVEATYRRLLAGTGAAR